MMLRKNSDKNTYKHKVSVMSTEENKQLWGNKEEENGGFHAALVMNHLYGIAFDYNNIIYDYC
jgi:hypothetical protein